MHSIQKGVYFCTPTSTLSTVQGFTDTVEEVVVDDSGFGLAILAMLLVIFIIWFSILNIGLQKIGVSIPKIIRTFLQEVSRLIKPNNKEV